MKIFASRPVGLVGILLLAAGCGSSGATGGGEGLNDASVDATSPGSDATTPPEDAGSSADSAPPPSSDDAGTCGDGIVEGVEACDDGASNGQPGDPCTSACAWVCVQGDPKLGDPACNDGNPCNGTETCLATHACAPGTPPAAGTSCGTGKICNNQVCAQAVCGDGFVTSPEECDDGSKNGTSGDGCTLTCKFVCVSTDPTRDCTPANFCQGQGTCNDTTHLCTAGTPLGTGTLCGGVAGDGGAPDGGTDAGPIDVCSGGTCVAGFCGDGVLETGEQCDFGAQNGAGTGCESNCTFSCTKSPNSCTTTNVCAGTNTCTNVTATNGDVGQKCTLGAPPANGSSCGSGGTCQGGTCQSSNCGNGVVDTGEQCDWGTANNISGSGCQPDCTFSCQKTPTDTCQTNVCAANPTVCTGVTGGPSNTPGQKCDATTAFTSCGDCSSTGVCVSGACDTSRCGDGCVDSRTGETCDPPNGTTCDANCHVIAAAVCGNGIRETGEQCDDGNTVNLDGCDSKCQFEQEQRAVSVAIVSAANTFCPHDALGTAVAGLATTILNNSLTTSVNAGTTTIAFKFMGITDLTGTAQASGLSLGSLSGAPAAAPTGVTYNGASDLDWWYTTTASTIDPSSRNPVSSLPATIAAKVLKASGSISLTINLVGATADLQLSGASLQANIGAVSTPTVSTGSTPGHLASENLDPTLQSFGSMNNGLLCGNISVASLATVPVPTTLAKGGSDACTQGYVTGTNSLLDVLVHGCTVVVLPVIAASQPDQIDPSQPAAGAGAPYTLGPSSGTQVTTCADKSSTVFTKPSAGFTACLAAAAYSSYFQFTSDRVIMK